MEAEAIDVPISVGLLQYHTLQLWYRALTCVHPAITLGCAWDCQEVGSHICGRRGEL